MFIEAAQAAEAASTAAESVGFFSNPESWVAITWLIVVAALVRPVGRALTKGLDGHRDRIKARIEEAERLRKEAQELLCSYQKKQREAQKEAESIVAQARAEAERIVTQGARDLDELLKRREQQAVDRIAQAEAEALREVRSAAVDIALAATANLITENLTPAQASALVDRQVKDLPNRLN